MWLCFALVIIVLLGSYGRVFQTLAPGAFSTWISHDSIFKHAPLTDGHNDFPIWIRAFYQNRIYQSNFTDDQELFGQVDFQRLRRGQSRAQFWSVYVECPKITDDYTDETYYESIHDTLQQIDLVYRLIRQFPEYLTHASTASDVWQVFHSGSRVASLMGIEGLHQIGNSASILRMYYALGVRYATLTHNCHNAYADSGDMPARHGGLSASGRAMVREMNRLGMVVDLSHTSHSTQRDTLQISAAPVIFSHSNAYTLCPHNRNVPDSILCGLQENGGVIMVTFYPTFLELNSSAASLMSVANHIQYIGETIGYRHVGVGSDFDGMEAGPEGLEDVSRYPDLIRELLSRGIPVFDVMGVMGLNIIRVLEDVERVAQSMRRVQPLEDRVKEFFQ
ncbi:renal dipeptidase family [Ustulina deusta]|nr:renal dipeptidase family [Ustulina deusta]